MTTAPIRAMALGACQYRPNGSCMCRVSRTVSRPPPGDAGGSRVAMGTLVPPNAQRSKPGGTKRNSAVPPELLGPSHARCWAHRLTGRRGWAHALCFEVEKSEGNHLSRRRWRDASAHPVPTVVSATRTPKSASRRSLMGQEKTDSARHGA